jgi:hypothetical protein
MIIPTSSECDTLLFAIPKTRSLITKEFDSIVNVLPRTDKLPVISTFDDIVVVSPEYSITESCKNLSEPTIGTKPDLNPETCILLPT